MNTLLSHPSCPDWAIKVSGSEFVLGKKTDLQQGGKGEFVFSTAFEAVNAIGTD